MVDLVSLLRIGTLALKVVIVFLFLLTFVSMQRYSPDFLRARISLQADTIKRGVLALLAGFLVVTTISLSFVLQMPLLDVWELMIIYPWLLLTLYGTYLIFHALRVPRRSRLGVAP